MPDAIRGLLKDYDALILLKGYGEKFGRSRTSRPERMSQDKKINILFIVNPVRGAGADMMLLEAATRLNRKRYRVMLGLLTDAPREDQFLLPDIPAFHFSMPEFTGVVWLRFLFRLCWVLRKYQVQIIHVNSYVPGNYVRLAALLMRVPLIIDHWHGFTRLNLKRRVICRVLGRFTDLSLAVCQGVRTYVLKHCWLDPARVKVVYNGVEQALFQRPRPAGAVRRDLGLPEEVPLLGLVARLDHWGKGHKELFTAMTLLSEQHPCHALIVGDGRRRGEMQQMAQDLGLSPRIHFLGNRQDVPDLLAAMDIFVLPSHSEGVSLALLEAMAAGLPVIVSEVGGLPEVVQHEENGLLIPVGDAEALAHSLSRVLRDPLWAQTLGEKARREVKTRFSLERLGQEINAIYDELVLRRWGPG